MNRLIYPGCVALTAVIGSSILQSPKLELLQKTLDEHSVKLDMLVESYDNIMLRQESLEKAHLSLEQKVAERFRRCSRRCREMEGI